jgi:hypothetical protein
LHEFALKDRPQKPTRRLAIADFVHDFESAYADEMDWRASKGGVSEREIRAIAAMSGEESGDSIVEATREIARRQAEDHLQSRLVQEFQTHTRLRVKEWEEVEDRLVFVHDGMPRENLIELVESWSDAEFEDEDDDELELPANLPSRALFAKLNARLPQERRFRKLDTVAQPVEADVYVAPEGGSDDEDDFDEDDE